MSNKALKIIPIMPIIFIIKLYQFIISPILKSNCRYWPTCSEYSVSVLKEHGLFRGLYFALKRILSCHPWGSTGYDPIPKKLNKKK
tara:strand:- start:145 stop:402 length:258 start_codon:yes stop_codon:yes gene_type:complete